MATGRIPTTANSPLTAKGDIFTFSTGSAKLAVGNNGETLVADSSTSTGLRYNANFAAGKNKIINGDFYVNQRNFSSESNSTAFVVDRWKYAGSSSTYTASVNTFTPGTAPVVGYEAKNFIRMVTSGQSGTGANAQFFTRIEDVRTFAGQTTTLSFWAKASSGTPFVAADFLQIFGTGGSSTVIGTGQKTAITTSWARYSFTFAIPSVSGKTISTSNDSSVQIEIFTSAGTDYNTRAASMGIQSATIDIWGIQWEEGSVASAFQTATGTIQGELAACQRYYYRITDSTGGFTSITNVGYARSTTQAYIPVVLPLQMRSITTLDTSNISLLRPANDTFYSTGTFTLLSDSQTTVVQSVNYTHGSAIFTQGELLTIGNANNASAFIGFSAEL